VTKSLVYSFPPAPHTRIFKLNTTRRPSTLHCTHLERHWQHDQYDVDSNYSDRCRSYLHTYIIVSAMVPSIQVEALVYQLHYSLAAGHVVHTLLQLVCVTVVHQLRHRDRVLHDLPHVRVGDVELRGCQFRHNLRWGANRTHWYLQEFQTMSKRCPTNIPAAMCSATMSAKVWLRSTIMPLYSRYVVYTSCSNSFFCRWDGHIEHFRDKSCH
jgi:hypothetical protein